MTGEKSSAKSAPLVCAVLPGPRTRMKVAALSSEDVGTVASGSPTRNPHMTRRDLLRVLGAAGGGVLAGCLPTGSTDFSSPAQPSTRMPATPTPVTSIAQPDCVITPQLTAGPFHFDVGLIRRDITEGKRGIPLRVAIRLVQATSCQPIGDAVVDVWHADAVGRYSGYRGQGDDNVDTTGETFLRGIQVTDADGVAEFETIYPGWYRGRTAHIHFKAYTGEQSFITSQLYFPDDTTDAVHLAEPYSMRETRGMTNANDRLFRSDLLGHITHTTDGYVVSLTVGVG